MEDRGVSTLEATARARARGGVYAALSLGFRDPTEGLAARGVPNPILDGLRAGGAALAIPWLDAECERLDRALAGLRAGAAWPRSLRLEYARLFLGPPSPRVLPYESFHRADPPDPRREYADAGWEFGEGFRDAPDHVSAELAFLAVLALGEAEALETPEASRVVEARVRCHRFLDRVSGWMPPFARAVERESRGSPYGALARAARATIRWDAARKELE